MSSRGNFYVALSLNLSLNYLFIYFAFDLTDFANSFVDEKNNNS